MAQLRLIALALVALAAACRRGEAAPSSGLAAPAGWRAAPDLATAAAGAAASDAVAVTGSEAWAEPARGCYAVWLALRGGAGPIDAAAEQLVASVQHDVPGVTVTDVAKPAAGDRGVLALAFAKAPYRGRLRATLVATGEVTALACLWNDREPKVCEAGCSALLGSVR